MNWTPLVLFIVFGSLEVWANRKYFAELDRLEGRPDMYATAADVRSSPGKLFAFVASEGFRSWRRLFTRPESSQLNRLRIRALVLGAAAWISFGWIVLQGALR